MMVTIRKHFVSPSIASKVTSGSGNTKKFITIHETDNANKGADADAHARLQANGNSRKASWHWTVDQKEAVQSFEHNVRCWAAGSSAGNNQSIQVEICVNDDYNKAVQNAAELVKMIMKQEGIGINNVVQHNHWSGKNCPSIMRSGKKITWSQFKAMLSGTSAAVSNPIVSSMTKSEILSLQKLLNLAAVDPRISEDGAWGPQTEAAVKQFQRRAGLVVDGIAGPNTLNKLKAVTREKEETPVEEYKKDAPVSPRFAEAQKWVKDNNISDGTYPQRPVTREELWSVLHRMSK